MANYIPTARSNYFAVKDVQAFRAFCARYDLTFIEGEMPESKGFVGFLSQNEQGIPSSFYDLEQNDDVEVDFAAELSKHLADGSVAVVMEVGFEKMRYLVGYAFAVNTKGETVSVNLDEIYERAKPLGQQITTATY